MVSDFIFMLWSLMQSIFDYIRALWNASGVTFTVFILGAVIMFALFNYFLGPYLQNAGSDIAKSTKISRKDNHNA